MVWGRRSRSSRSRMRRRSSSSSIRSSSISSRCRNISRNKILKSNSINRLIMKDPKGGIYRQQDMRGAILKRLITSSKLEDALRYADQSMETREQVVDM